MYNHQPGKQDSVSKLVFELSKLPGIGEKTATRLAYFIIKQDAHFAQSLADSIIHAKQRTGLCQECFNFSDIDPCRICSDSQRDHSLICIVEKPADVFSIEQSGAFKGVYHVLHGALSPLDGIGPDELKIRELLNRMMNSSSSIQELILATNPSVEGEATSLYLAKLTKPMNIRLTKLAHGLPVGGMLEYTDRQTIGKALENRMEMT